MAEITTQLCGLKPVRCPDTEHPGRGVCQEVWNQYNPDTFGGATRVNRFVEGVKCLQMRGPEDLDADGWLLSSVGLPQKVTDRGFVPAHDLPPARKPRSRSIEAMLVEVCRLTVSNR